MGGLRTADAQAVVAINKPHWHTPASNTLTKRTLTAFPKGIKAGVGKWRGRSVQPTFRQLKSPTQEREGHTLDTKMATDQTSITSEP